MVTQVTGGYADLYAWENLYRAWRKAARGKRGRGAAAAFEYRLEDNLFQLQEELATERYQPGAYASFTIHEPKRRLISAAPFRDRVVHHALCNVIEPAFERSFIAHAYANRTGKGTHRALDQCQRWARRYPFVLQCDLRQFFPIIRTTMWGCGWCPTAFHPSARRRCRGQNTGPATACPARRKSRRSRFPSAPPAGGRTDTEGGCPLSMCAARPDWGSPTHFTAGRNLASDRRNRLKPVGVPLPSAL